MCYSILDILKLTQLVQFDIACVYSIQEHRLSWAYNYLSFNWRMDAEKSQV